MTAIELEQPVYAAVSYDRKGAAAACGLSIETLRQAIDSGDLVAHWRGSKPVIRAADLDAWIRSLPTARSSP